MSEAKMPHFLMLKNPVQNYDWGSPDTIPDFLGMPLPRGVPVAELWIGGHPAAPSRVCRAGQEIPLNALIAQWPEEVLGEAAQRFSGEFPFLLKMLAAAKPLSIQAHPNRAQAREGFLREDDAGIPRDAVRRLYRDKNAKPEMLCAWGAPFHALCGFRPPSEIAANFSRLGSAGLDPALDALRGARDPAAGVRQWVEFLWRMDPSRARTVVEATVAAALRFQGEEDAWAWVRRLGEIYPGDVGVLFPLILHHVVLKPGEAIAVDAGVPHAYLRGTGVEIMACSDNVLRGGLSSKHVDLDELLRVMTFSPAPPHRLFPEAVSAGEVRFPVFSEAFALSVISLDSPDARREVVDRSGVEVLWCMEGAVELGLGAQGEASLGKGEAALVPAATSRYWMRGPGQVIRATVPVSGSGGRG